MLALSLRIPLSLSALALKKPSKRGGPPAQPDYAGLYRSFRRPCKKEIPEDLKYGGKTMKAARLFVTSFLESKSVEGEQW